MKISLAPSGVNFKYMPYNYAKVDNYLSRSAQPLEEDFLWLKEQGVTDVINFRTMFVPGLDFDEEKVVTSLGMKYHNIPTETKSPKEEDVKYFLSLVDDISKNCGKAHIHCKAGADRTGMYAFIYKAFKFMGSLLDNEIEWLELGHNPQRFPNLRSWAKNFINKYNINKFMY